MLSCRACFWRCTQALGIPPANALRLRRNVNPNFPNGQQRQLSTRDGAYGPTASYSHPSEVERLSRSRDEPWKKSAVAANQKKREYAALRQSPARGPAYDTPNLSKLGRRDPQMTRSEWDRRTKELRHLQDPLELATFVQNELRKDKAKEMLQLVRMASHSMQCTVSWNYIVDHHLAQGRVNEALKIYNEMKKCAQFPDAYTYTILLRGLSINAHTSGVLTKALSVYHSLYAPNSRVEPSIVHTNAALRVCARALDMDALWGIAGKIPEKGPAAANAITYITIINAIRQNLLVNGPQGETKDEEAARKERGIIEVRRMWGDIVGRWRDADLIIDEELVCAVGRLLLVGSRLRDWDDVFSLVEQTMDIPRLLPPLGTPARQEAGLPRWRAPIDDDYLALSNSPVRGDEFSALDPPGAGGKAVPNPLAYAQSGNNTLSLIQEACLKVDAHKAAEQYWDLLTDSNTYNIKPDLSNLNMRLRSLRLKRASSAAVKLLQEDMIAQGIVPRPGTLRIAMSTCVRDKNNHNALNNANRILNLMLKTFEDVDARTVTMYAELALRFPLAKGSDLIDALTILQPVVRNIRLQLGAGGQRKTGAVVGASRIRGDQREDLIIALRKVHGVYDRLLFSNLIEEEQKSPFKAEKARLSSFIRRIIYKSGMTMDPVMEQELNEELGSAEADPAISKNAVGDGADSAKKLTHGRTGISRHEKQWEDPGKGTAAWSSGQ